MIAGAARGGIAAAVPLGAALVAAACASNSQRVYAAPTGASGLVSTFIDTVRGSPLHTRRIMLANASTQSLVAYEVELYDCRRVQLPCGSPAPIRVLVPPGERRELLRIESTDTRYAPYYRYRYRWRYARNRQEVDSLIAHAPSP